MESIFSNRLAFVPPVHIRRHTTTRDDDDGRRWAHKLPLVEFPDLVQNNNNKKKKNLFSLYFLIIRQTKRNKKMAISRAA